MEQRQSPRVCFFQLHHNHELQPIWVFRHNDANTILGLVLDISNNGVQLLTQKESPLTKGLYQLKVYVEDEIRQPLCTVNAIHLWSKFEGGLYIRHGLSFAHQAQHVDLLSLALSAKDETHQWLRCELLPTMHA